jgi:hypothetical protein
MRFGDGANLRSMRMRIEAESGDQGGCESEPCAWSREAGQTQRLLNGSHFVYSTILGLNPAGDGRPVRLETACAHEETDVTARDGFLNDVFR